MPVKQRATYKTNKRMGLAAQQTRAREIYALLERLYPEVRCTLDHRSPLQLLIMTILAAQCTDARVNQVTPALFKRYRKARDFAKAQPEELEGMIHSCGFFRQKARSIIETCRILDADYGGEVPDTMDQLTRLPGVGRKTANVILGECFGKQGVIVDTHCTRLARRLDFTKNTDAAKIERDLMRLWPPDCWTMFSHFLVFHGRAVCTARAPQCSLCALNGLCAFPRRPEGRNIAR